MTASVLAAVALAVAAQPNAGGRGYECLDRALQDLERQGRFSGAIVIQRRGSILFARGYGQADPFSGRAFTPDTQSESGSLAKPATAAIILSLVGERRLSLDSPVRAFVAEYPEPVATVRDLLTHSAGLPGYGRFDSIAGKTTAHFLSELSAGGWKPAFAPGSRFSYCNLCFDTLALIAERVEGRSFQTILESRLFRPAGMTSSRIRPQKLADWTDRAIGYRRTATGLEAFDSWEGEAFYGSSNIAFTARDLARFGSFLAGPGAARLRLQMTAPATIAGSRSGLTIGNLYCASGLSQCQYTGHHEGFHGFLYWDSRRELAVAMLTNNTLAPSLQPRLQRALVAYAEGRASDARRELALAGPAASLRPGRYRLGRHALGIVAASGELVDVRFRGLTYTAFPIGEGWHYAPGLDAYLAGDGAGVRWLTLYDDQLAVPTARRPVMDRRGVE